MPGALLNGVNATARKAGVKLKQRLPSIGGHGEYVEADGLMRYGLAKRVSEREYPAHSRTSRTAIRESKYPSRTDPHESAAWRDAR